MICDQPVMSCIHQRKEAPPPLSFAISICRLGCKNLPGSTEPALCIRHGFRFKVWGLELVGFEGFVFRYVQCLRLGSKLWGLGSIGFSNIIVMQQMHELWIP